jgi:hypothetical protein
MAIAWPHRWLQCYNTSHLLPFLLPFLQAIAQSHKLPWQMLLPVKQKPCLTSPLPVLCNQPL